MNLRFVILACTCLIGLAALVGCGPTYLNPTPDARAVADLRDKIDKAGGAAAPAEGPMAAAANPTGFATFEGKFVVEGTPRANSPKSITKDFAVCAPGGKQVLTEDVVVGPGGGLANVVIYAEKVPPAWCHETMKPGSAADKPLEFDQKNCVFVPHVFACQMNQPVTLKNSDPVDHNTALKSSKTVPFDQTVPAGSSTKYVPQGKEEDTPYNVACAIHTWMSAYMITRNDGYFAVTGPDGSFKIPNVPAGVKLKFRVWQESLKGTIKVKVNGKDVQWKAGRFEETLEPDQTLKYEVTIDAAAFGG